MTESKPVPSAQHTRFDPDGTPFNDGLKPLVPIAGYPAQLSIDPQLAQLLRLRVATVNRCTYCVVLHSEAARDREIEQRKIDQLPVYSVSEDYSEAERAALAYCDALGRSDVDGFQSHHDRALEHFTVEQIIDIAAVVTNMEAWTRWKLASGQLAPE